MLSDEEKKEYEELKSLLYQGTLTQYGKRKLIGIIEKQSKEIEELKNADLTTVYLNGVYDGEKKVEDKIKAKIEEIKNTGIDEAWEQVNYTIREQDRAKIQVLQSLLEKE